MDHSTSMNRNDTRIDDANSTQNTGGFFFIERTTSATSLSTFVQPMYTTHMLETTCESAADAQRNRIIMEGPNRDPERVGKSASKA